MSKHSAIAVCLLSVFWLALPNQGVAQTPHAREVALKSIVESLLDDLDGASVTVGSNGLEAKYRVQEFRVHTVFRDGTIADESHAIEGPNKGGFLLRVRVKSGTGYMGPIALSREGFGTIRNPYWITQVREIKLPNNTEYAWITIAKGLDVDEDLIAALNKEIYTLMTAE